jgi:hypothetical protein
MPSKEPTNSNTKKWYQPLRLLQPILWSLTFGPKLSVSTLGLSMRLWMQWWRFAFRSSNNNRPKHCSSVSGTLMKRKKKRANTGGKSAKMSNTSGPKYKNQQKLPSTIKRLKNSSRLKSPVWESSRRKILSISSKTSKSSEKDLSTHELKATYLNPKRLHLTSHWKIFPNWPKIHGIPSLQTKNWTFPIKNNNFPTSGALKSSMIYSTPSNFNSIQFNTPNCLSILAKLSPITWKILRQKLTIMARISLSKNKKLWSNKWLIP